MASKPGDEYPACGGTISVYCTRRTADSIVRFLGCRRRGDPAGGCGATTEKVALKVGSTDIGSIRKSQRKSCGKTCKEIPPPAAEARGV